MKLAKGLVLAAGRGQRMGSHTENSPKCMVTLDGRTLFDRQLAAMNAAGLQEVGVVTGYQKEAFAPYGFTTFQNDRWSQSNMVRSLLAAQPWLQTSDTVVSYSDIIYAPEVVTSLLQSSADLSVAFHRNWQRLWEARFVNPLDDAESFSVDDSLRIVDIGRKVQSIDQINGQYMGLLKFTPAGWEKVSGYLASLDSAAVDRLDMTSLLQALIKSGVCDVQGVPYEGLWLEVDSAEDLALYESWAQTRGLDWWCNPGA
jgi:choline kinase